MLYREIIAVCSENYTKHTYTVWENVQFSYVKGYGTSDGTYGNR
jgi:hypothetical protein